MSQQSSHDGSKQQLPVNNSDEGLSGERIAILPPDSKQNLVLRSDYYQEGVPGDFRRELLGPKKLVDQVKNSHWYQHLKVEITKHQQWHQVLFVVLGPELAEQCYILEKTAGGADSGDF